MQYLITVNNTALSILNSLYSLYYPYISYTPTSQYDIPLPIFPAISLYFPSLYFLNFTFSQY